MSTHCIKLIPALMCVLLSSCASGPESSGPEQSTETTAITTATNGTPTPATPLKIDEATQAAFNTAVDAMKNGRDDQALKMFADLAQKQPNLAAAFVNIGLLHLKHQRFEPAKDNFLQATTVQPNDAVGQTHLGITYRYLGMFKEASQAYEQALKSNPDYAFAHLNAGILYDIYLDDLSKALGHYERYQSLTNNDDKTVEKWVVDLKRRLGQKS